MRIPAVLLGAMIALSASGAAADNDNDLIVVSSNPDLAPFAAKVRDLLIANGKPCDRVTKLNAYPQTGNALLAVLHCSGGQRYEGLFDGSSVQISTVN